MDERWRVVLQLSRWDSGPLLEPDVEVLARLLAEECPGASARLADGFVWAEVSVEAADRDSAVDQASELLRACAYATPVRMPPFDLQPVEAELVPPEAD